MLERTLALFRDEMGFAPPMPTPPIRGSAGLAAFLRAGGARVIVPDMRGFGDSDKPDDPAAYADSAMARDVVALIDHLGLDSVDVCGFSMGSLNAAKLLALGPASVRSAVLAGIGDYILEGEVMDLPEQWPLPDHLPRPVTLPVHAEEGARLLERGEIERGNVLATQVIMARATAADPRVLAAVLRGTMAEPVPPAALAQAAPVSCSTDGPTWPTSRPAAAGGDAAGARRRLRGRSRIDALRAVVPASGARLLRRAAAGPRADATVTRGCCCRTQPSVGR